MNRNKNPLNVKQVSGSGWKGSVGADARGHAVFEDPAYGIRAAMRCFHSKYRNGKRTIKAIVFDWAPADDTEGSLPGGKPNDPEAYLRFVDVCVAWGKLDVLPDPVEDPVPWMWLLRAMAQYEMGEPCPWVEVVVGMVYWFKDFVGEVEGG